MKLLTIRDLKAIVSSTFNNLPTAKSRSARFQPSSFSTNYVRYSHKITPQKNESASSALRQATLSPGAVNTTLPVLLSPWHRFLLVAMGKFHIIELVSGTTLSVRSCAHATLYCTIHPSFLWQRPLRESRDRVRETEEPCLENTVNVLPSFHQYCPTS
jgi:hypothetical protein